MKFSQRHKGNQQSLEEKQNNWYLLSIPKSNLGYSELQNENHSASINLLNETIFWYVKSPTSNRQSFASVLPPVEAIMLFFQNPAYHVQALWNLLQEHLLSI